MSDNSKETPKLKTPAELLTPEAQAVTSRMISDAVRETVTAIFASMGPLMKDLALTPEKLRDAEELRRMPSAAQQAREQREKAIMLEQEAENRKTREARVASCPHRYPSGQIAIQVVHNYPDRAPRGICPICQVFIEPKRWVVGAPDPKTGKANAYIAEAHPLFHLVLEKEAMAGA